MQTVKKLITVASSAGSVCRLRQTAKTFAVRFLVLCRLPRQTANQLIPVVILYHFWGLTY
jgi:hypothetical protein